MHVRYKHDCSVCKFIATTAGDRFTDWYVCVGSNALNTSVVGRRSSDGPDYWSSPADMLAQLTGPASAKSVFSETSIVAKAMFGQAVAQGLVPSSISKDITA